MHSGTDLLEDCISAIRCPEKGSQGISRGGALPCIHTAAFRGRQKCHGPDQKPFESHCICCMLYCETLVSLLSIARHWSRFWAPCKAPKTILILYAATTTVNKLTCEHVCVLVCVERIYTYIYIYVYMYMCMPITYLAVCTCVYICIGIYDLHVHTCSN